ncbi:MAG TPA: HWE histidine kinase domain-containing protein [Microvirga sp.]|jgi:PAS domain S-box-containing protein|nr:HWE histidine kinase domain-containing protein [Microvirga sp.]
MSRLDEAMRVSRDAPTAMAAATALLAQHLGASRCAYADVDPDNDRFVIRSDYTAPGIASSIGTYSLDLFGARASADMRGGRTLVVCDVPEELGPGEGREMFLSIGIGAIVCCPLVKNGRLIAMMAVHQNAPRRWREEEIKLVETVVERCWAQVERVGAEARLRESEEFNRRILESSSDCIKVLDTSARLQFMSPGALRIMEVDDFGTIEGCDWREFWSGPDRDRAREAVRIALEGGNARFQGQTPTLKGRPKWWDVAVTPINGPNGEVEKLLSVSRDITDTKQAEEHQRLLINELNHRVKNTLATVQSIATQTPRNSRSPEEARSAMEARLMALSKAHDVLTRQNWESANLREIVAQALAPYGHARENRLHLQGPDIRLQPRTALALAMALQELATNAVKYGSLSNETGEVRIEWSLDALHTPPCLSLTWRESGGPPVEEPSRRGFGTRLIERSLAQDLDGKVTIAFAPDGVVCKVTAPIVTAGPGG